MADGPKKLVICCDGTGQKLDVQRSNVVRLFSVLDRANPAEQMAYYDAGVGTMPATGALTFVSRRLTLWSGLLGGYGLLDRVSNAYGFIVDAYRDGDEIYLFGFSRGALTVRMVAGLLHRVGVLRREAKNLIPYALELYRRHYTHIADRSQRQLVRGVNAEFRRAFSVSTEPVNIRFLGLWDTVKAFGVFRPQSFPHLRHNPDVRVVRHALALDERRRSYMFTSWGGLSHFVEEGPPADQSVKEVWFAGSHRDVGGGHPDSESGLSWLAFRWMVGEARHAELKLDDDKLRENMPAALASPEAAILRDHFFTVHDSRTSLWRAIDVVPRIELANAPPRDANTREHLEDGLPVPVGWPKRPFRFIPITGERHPGVYRREGPLLVHWSVRPFVTAGRYSFRDFAYVDDASLTGAARQPVTAESQTR